MADLITFILEIYVDIQFWIKHKKRRKFEKENNLPKSIVWHPITKLLFILFLIFIPSFFLFSFFTSASLHEEKTIEK